MKIIELNNISRKFIEKDPRESQVGRHNKGNFWALKNINLGIEKGEIVGIIGRNGSGKTTLLKVVSGIIPPTEGEINVRGEAVSILTLGAGFQDELSGRENIFLNGSLLGLSKEEIEERYQEVVNFSELNEFIGDPLGSYSDGMKMRLGFSIAINTNFEILAVDEVIMVGDISFQKKCFRKFLELKENNKTMLISTQSMEVIKRLCDRTVLLESGTVKFCGDTEDAVGRYLKLLNEKSFIGKESRSTLVKSTKRWATDMDRWGKKEGTGEVEIDSVETYNRWGVKTEKFTTGNNMKVKVNFKVHEKIEDFHFGVALFKENGIYCYGTNTKSQESDFSEMENGRGFFEIEYKRLPLTSGKYYLAIAIWDKDEALAFDYHRCCYRIDIIGNSKKKTLLNIPHKWKPRGLWEYIFGDGVLNEKVKLNKIEGRWGSIKKSEYFDLERVKLLDRYGREKDQFFTNDVLRINVEFNILKENINKKIAIWIGLFRNDNIYCEGDIKKLNTNHNEVSLIYPELKLLPGKYNVSLGFIDLTDYSYIFFNHGRINFRVVFDRKDHGTVYIDHKWKWKIPR